MAISELLSGKVALVTGGGSGIGRATAIRFAEQGADVAVLDVNKEDLNSVSEEIENLGRKSLKIEADISSPEEMEACYAKIIDTFGTLDILFANAGINGTLAPIEDLTAEDWEKTSSINGKGTFLTLKYAIPHLKENGGSVIITSSVNGSRIFNNFGFTAYSASKASQIALGKMAALELAQFNIRVNIICPGAIDTNIDKNTAPQDDKLKEIEIPIDYPEGSQPLEGKGGSPQQVADTVLYLASDLSSHVSGTQIFIDGAESLLQ